MSFVPIYFGTLTAIIVGDRLGFLHPSKSAWDTFPSYNMPHNYTVPESSLNLLVFSLSVLVPVVAVWRYFWKRCVLPKLAEMCMGRKANHTKFLEQAWLALHYTTVTLLEYYVLRDKKWWPPHTVFEHLHAPLEERKLDQEDFGIQTIYATQFAFYVLEFISLVANRKNRKRSDTMVYFVHHVYTVSLMFGSWLTWNHRIGTLVLILHDVGDIFLPIGKCFTYSETHVKRACSKFTFQVVQAAGIMSFVLFIIAFAIPRLFVLGRLLYIIPYELNWTLCVGEMKHGVCDGEFCPAPFFNGFLLILLMLLWAMHVFWMWLIVKMAKNVVLGKYQDVRSDDEEDSCDNDDDEEEEETINSEAEDAKKR